jgi:hypothetical protein
VGSVVGSAVGDGVGAEDGAVVGDCVGCCRQAGIQGSGIRLQEQGRNQLARRYDGGIRARLRLTSPRVLRFKWIPA